MRLLASTEDVEEGSVLSCRVDGIGLLVGKADGRYFAVEDMCPHAWVPFVRGHLKGCKLTCPWHGLGFDVRTGICEDWPDLTKLRRFQVTEEEGNLFLGDEVTEVI